MCSNVSLNQSIESAQCDASIATSVYGHDQMKEFITKYAEKQSKVYSDVFLSKLGDGLLDGCIKFKCKELIKLCRAANLDEGTTEETCADLIWPICNYRKFPDIYDECVQELDDALFHKAVGVKTQASAFDPVMVGKIDGAIIASLDMGCSPTEAAANAMAASGCNDHIFLLERVKYIVNLTTRTHE